MQRLPRENGDVRVMVRYPQEERESLAMFEDVRIRTVDGRLVPLLEIDDAEWHVLRIDVGRRKKSEVTMFEQEL